jgi:xanthine dehydrogenase YagS FAD-binding subunit
MRSFAYERAESLDDAIRAASDPDTQLLAGGTELLNWMKEGIVRPGRLVDLGTLEGLDGISAGPHGLRIGAAARLSEVASHPDVVRAYPAIAQALLQSASPQIRNMATVAGNLLQRTRCPYFRAERPLSCNKRQPGSGCAALVGADRSAALFGGSARCVATHPSDLAVALAALDAELTIEGPGGRRRLPVAALHRLPGDTPERETELAPGELVTEIAIPATAAAATSSYVKVRERASFEFALVSAAAAVELRDGAIRVARLALGGVAPRPWRLPAAEAALAGLSLVDGEALRRALAPAFADARPGRDNGFKIELAQRTAVRALQIAGGIA